MNTFETQPNIQQKALKKALKSPFIGKHGKRKITLALEEVRKENAQKLLAETNSMIDIQVSIAKSSKISPSIRLKATEMILTRALGKPAQQKDIVLDEPVPIDPEEKERIGKLIDGLVHRCGDCNKLLKS